MGATNTVLPIVNTSADVGYGTVIAATAGFGVITEMLANIPGSPLISLYVAIAALAGITGTASGGLGIAMETLAQTYLDLGVDPEALHRVATIASGSLDSLPHNGAVITVLAVIGLTHKDAYKHIFFCFSTWAHYCSNTGINYCDHTLFLGQYSRLLIKP